MFFQRKINRRIGIIFALVGQIAILGVYLPQSAHAAPTITLPTNIQATTSFTNVNTAGALSLSGYEAGVSVQVTITVDSGFVKIGTTTGLTAPAGYTSDSWTATNSSEIAFYGTESQVSTALNSLQYKAIATDAPATISVTSFVAGAAFNSATKHFYEIIDNTSVINWEDARCKAKWGATSSFNGTVSTASVRGNTSYTNDRCTNKTSRRTIGGLEGYLATITSLDEQKFLLAKFTGTGWIGGADIDSEGTFIWMDGPETGQVFWTPTSGSRRGDYAVNGSVSNYSYGSGSNRFNYFSDGEPNNSGSAEHWAEFGFGSAGVGGSWNDCQNACNRTKYVVEYGEVGNTLSGASGTINVNPRVVVGTEIDYSLLLNDAAAGTQHARLDSSTALGTFNAISIQMWVKPKSGTTCEGNLLSKANNFALYCVSGELYYALSGASAWSGVNTRIPIPSGSWSHIALTRIASTTSNGVKIYLNGRNFYTGSADGAGTSNIGNSNATYLNIGGRGNVGDFRGAIDEVKIWATDRSASVATDMNSNETTTSNLVGYWNFNEGTGTKIFNQVSGASYATDLVTSGAVGWENVAISSTVEAYTVVTIRRTIITSAGGWKAPRTVKSSILTVAGGGGGGSRHAGGGGGGGVSYAPTYALTSGATYEIKVGVGGIGYGQPGNNAYMSGSTFVTSAGGDSSGSGTSGANSTFKPTNILESITAIGGGGGGGAGLSGGSGGGSSSGSLSVGSSTKYSTSFFTSYGNIGGLGYSGSGCGSDFCGGGGGGAGSAGGTPTVAGASDTDRAGNGGAGFAIAIESLTDSYYGGGGGGGSKDPGLDSTGGSGGGGAGGKSAQGANGTNGLGGGGGGGGHFLTTSYRGGNGGSGVIMIRWITATAPIFTGPTFDTLTAGLTETFTVTGTSDSPLTRNYRWQVSTDTGTSWSNASQGSGFLTANYNTPTLETNTSGIRYQYRVVVTDSDTAGLFIVDTSTAVYLKINPRNTITSSTSSFTFSQKYGESQTVTFTFANGTGPRTSNVVTTTNNSNGRIAWSNLNGDSATVRITNSLWAGTFYETLTVTDSVTAFTSQLLTINVSKADTITVTISSTSSTFTYSTNSVAGNLNSSVSGLVNSETGTVTSQVLGVSDALYSANCATGGTCKVGDLAPGGGYVFYVADKIINKVSGISEGGIYLATAPINWKSGTTGDPTSSWGCQTSVPGTLSAIGAGAANTKIVVNAQSSCTTDTVAAKVAADLSIDSSGTTYADWFLPSESEIAYMYSNVRTIAALNKPVYWTSQQAYGLTELQNTFNALAYEFTSFAVTIGCANPVGNPCVLQKNGNTSSTYGGLRPIRAFSPQNLATAQDPVKTGVYLTNYSFSIASPASVENYQAVDYIQAAVTVSQAGQQPLKVGQYDAYPGKSTYPLNVFGGTGTGTLTRTGPLGAPYSNTAGCSLSGSFYLSATSAGICTMQVVKAGDRNYMTETNTATIYWIEWKDSYATQVLSGGHTIPLNGGTQVIVHTETVTAGMFTDTATPTSNSISGGKIGDTIRILSTGYGGLDKSQVSVTFRPMEDAVVNDVQPTYIEVVVPSGAITGVIALDSPRGVAYTTSFTISP